MSQSPSSSTTMSQSPSSSTTMSQSSPPSTTMALPSPPSTTMAPPSLENGKKKTKGRQRVENRRVEKKESRQVTFSKRKAGLWKKASELAVLCHAPLAIVVFSEAGKAFAFGSPSADAVLGCTHNAGVPAADDVDWKAMEALFRATQEKSAEVKAEAERMTAIGNKVVEVQKQGGKQFWWEADVNELGAEELQVFVRSLQRLRDNVARRVLNQ